MPIHEGHREVHDNDLRRQFPGEFHRLRAVARLADHRQLGVIFEHPVQGLPEERVIIDEQH